MFILEVLDAPMRFQSAANLCWPALSRGPWESHLGERRPPSAH